MRSPLVCEESYEDELTHGSPRKRLGDCEKLVKTTRVSRDDHDRSMLRPGGLALRREIGFLAKNGLLELPKDGARIDPELVNKQAPRLPIDVQRLSLPARSIEREHELRAETFAEGVVAHEHLELSDNLGVSSELEVSCDPPLDAKEMNLFEP